MPLTVLTRNVPVHSCIGEPQTGEKAKSRSNNRNLVVIQSLVVILGLQHDLIDPEQPNQPIEIIYPQLIELITNEK